MICKKTYFIILPILTSHFRNHIWMFQCFMGFLLEKISFEIAYILYPLTNTKVTKQKVIGESMKLGIIKKYTETWIYQPKGFLE